jgi:hypothetical protein
VLKCIQAAPDAFTFMKIIFRAALSQRTVKVVFVPNVALLQLNKLFDPTFVSQVRQYPHKSIIVNIDVVQYDRMVNLAEFLDEFLYYMLFSLIFSV